MQQPSPFDLQRMLRLALYVIVRPTEYFRTMPRGGSLAEPVIFTMVLSLLGAVIFALLALPMTQQLPALGDLLLLPGLVCGGAMVVALVLMLLWKMLGSREGYVTAMRCVAATMALVPVTSLLAFWPSLALVVNALWSIYLLYVASLEVHGIGRAKALSLLALLAALAGASLWSNYVMQTLVQSQRLQLGVDEQTYKRMSPQERQALDQKVLENLRQRREELRQQRRELPLKSQTWPAQQP